MTKATFFSQSSKQQAKGILDEIALLGGAFCCAVSVTVLAHFCVADGCHVWEDALTDKRQSATAEPNDSKLTWENDGNSVSIIYICKFW